VASLLEWRCQQGCGIFCMTMHLQLNFISYDYAEYRFSTTQRTSTTANESHAIAHASIRLKLAAAGAWLRSCDFAAQITPKFQPPAHAAPTSKSVSTLGVCQQSVRVCLASTCHSLSNRQHRASDCCDLPSIGAYRSPVNTHINIKHMSMLVQAGV